MPASSRSPALAGVLSRSDVWRGDSLARAALPGVPSGFAALDAELPGGGWPRGGLVELLPARQGIGELSLLMPALAHVSANELSWVVCVAPPLPPYAPAWAAAGVALSHLLVTRAVGGDAAWACARAIDAEGVGALVAWLPESDPATRRPPRVRIAHTKPAGAARICLARIGRQAGAWREPRLKLPTMSISATVRSGVPGRITKSK